MLIDTIVSDMDDTLLAEDCTLSPYTIDVLRRCTERGIRVIPASGRAMKSLLPYLRQLNTGSPAIGCNGAQLIAPDLTLLSCQEFDAELVLLQDMFTENGKKYGNATLLADGVHPTLAGGVMLGNEWLKVFDKM